MGTKISGFRQTPRGRCFSPTWFNPCLKSIQMVEIVGAGTTLHFSPKDLGLNAGFSSLFSNSSELNFRDCIQIVRTKFIDCFRTVRSLNFGTVLGGPGADFRTIISPCMLCLCFC